MGPPKEPPIYCPKCGSTKLKWMQPWIGQVYDCQECGYRGSLVVQDGELAREIRKKWLRNQQPRE